MGVATGAAIAGKRPIVEIMFVDFATLAMSQLVNHAAKLRYMSGGQLRVPMVVRLQQGAVGRGPAGGVRSFGHAGDLLGREAGLLGEDRVLRPLVAAVAQGSDPEHQELPLPGRQCGAAQEVAVESEESLGQLRVPGEGAQQVGPGLVLLLRPAAPDGGPETVDELRHVRGPLRPGDGSYPDLRPSARHVFRPPLTPMV